MATTILIALLTTMSLIIYRFVESELSHEAGRHIAGTKFGEYIDLCCAHGLRLDIANLPDRDGDESFRTFSFTRAGVTRVLRPRKTLRVLRAIKAGDTDRAFAILKMAQA